MIIGKDVFVKNPGNFLHFDQKKRLFCGDADKKAGGVQRTPLPRKNTATVPGPECAPTIGPI